MERRTGSKGAPIKLCPLVPCASSEGTAGCVGQSLRCRVLGEETSGAGQLRAQGARRATSPGGRGRGAGESPGMERTTQHERSPERRFPAETAQDAGSPGRRRARDAESPGAQLPGGAEPGLGVPGAGAGPGRGAAGAERSSGCGMAGAARGGGDAARTPGVPARGRAARPERCPGGAPGARRGRGPGGGAEGRGGEGGPPFAALGPGAAAGGASPPLAPPPGRCGSVSEAGRRPVPPVPRQHPGPAMAGVGFAAHRLELLASYQDVIGEDSPTDW